MSEKNAFPIQYRYNSGWKTLFILCSIVVVVRLIATGIMGMMPQDAYYDLYAEHLALSYYDHPPMIAYILRLFTSIFGKNVFAVKLADTVVTIFTVIAFYHFAKRFLNIQQVHKALILFLSTLMVSILSIISTPDVPLMFFWTITLICFYEAIWKGRKIYWIWAGIFTGLSFDSKYTAIFLIFGLFGFLVFSKAYRKLIFSRWIILYILCFTITIAPVVIWNWQNNFASFRFQSQNRVNEGLQIDPSNFLGVIGHQSAVLLPILFFSFLYFFYRTLRKYGVKLTKIPSDLLFLICFFVPLFLGFLFLSVIYWVKVNWMFPAYITGICWVCRFWNIKWLKYQLILSVIVHVALLCEVAFYIVPIRSDDTWYGWKEFSIKVEEMRKQYPDAFIFSIDDYKTAAMLNFYLHEPVYANNIVGRRALQFDYIGTDLSKLQGKNALYIDSNPRFENLQPEKNAPEFFNKYFDEIIPLQPILVVNKGHVERKFSVYLCRNYKINKAHD